MNVLHFKKIKWNQEIIYISFNEEEKHMERLIVNFDVMQSEISKMNELNDEYYRLYGSLLNQVDESSLYWKGEDHDAFMDKIHGFEEDFNRLYRLLGQYIGFVDKSLQTYRMAQEAAKASSLRM